MFRLTAILLLFFATAHAQSLQWHQIITHPAEGPGEVSSFRGLSVVNDSIAWVSGSKGWVGRSSDGGAHWSFAQVKGYEKCDFRSLYAFDARHAVIANAGSPAYILMTNDGGNTWQKVYEDNDTAAFFDGISFWNSSNGIIYGDPKDGRLEVLLTNNGGKSWQRMPGKHRPKVEKGEASFAASGTTIQCRGRSWVGIATGGVVSRLWVSKNKGRKWRAIKTPVIQGQSSQGIFSFSVIGRNIIIAGGDYLHDTLKDRHIYYSADAGRHWQAPEKPTGGYRECIVHLIDGTFMAIGPGGADISTDAGRTWRPVSDERQFHVVKKARSGSLIIAAGSKGKLAVLKQ